MKAIKVGLYLFLGLWLATPIISGAAEFRSNNEGTVRVENNETTGNLYLFGNNVISDGRIRGDITTAGSNLTIGGIVDQSLMAAGGNVTVNGEVAQNARVAGGTVNYHGEVAQDLLIAGGTVNISQAAVITGDVLVAGGTVIVDGTINGRLLVAGGAVSINGRIIGDVNARVDTLTIGNNANIGGKLKYHSPKEANVSNQARIIGGVEFVKTEQKATTDLAQTLTLAFFIDLIALLLLSILLRYLLPNLTANSVSRVYDRGASSFFLNFVIGIALLIALPIITFILIISLIGFRLALVLGLWYALTLALAAGLAPILIGYLLFRLFRARNPLLLGIGSIITGVVIYKLIGLIPFVGGVILFIFFSTAFSALNAEIFDRLKTAFAHRKNPDPGHRIDREHSPNA